MILFAREPNPLPFDEAALLTGWALRFDGYKFRDSSGFASPREVRQMLGTAHWEFTDLEELWIFFSEQRGLMKWGGEHLPPDHPEWQFFRRMFLRTARYDIPAEFRDRGRHDEWERRFAPHTGEALSYVARVHQTIADAPNRAERLRGMLLGMVVGYCLGQTIQGLPTAARRENNGGRDVTVFDAGPLGSSLRLALTTVDSLLEHPKVVPADLMARVAKENNLSHSIHAAVTAFRSGTPAHSCGQPTAGNGALLRALPVVVSDWQANEGSALHGLKLATLITHQDEAAVAASVGFGHMLLELAWGRCFSADEWISGFLNGADTVNQTKQYEITRGGSFTGTLSGLVGERREALLTDGNRIDILARRLGSGSYLFETVPAILAILASCGHDPEHALIRAANDTHDCDTIAAVVGAVLGTRFGSTPFQRWIPELSNLAWGNGSVLDLVDQAVSRWTPAW